MLYEDTIVRASCVRKPGQGTFSSRTREPDPSCRFDGSCNTCPPRRAAWRKAELINRWFHDRWKHSSDSGFERFDSLICFQKRSRESNLLKENTKKRAIFVRLLLSEQSRLSGFDSRYTWQRIDCVFDKIRRLGLDGGFHSKIESQITWIVLWRESGTFKSDGIIVNIITVNPSKFEIFLS